jgi:aminomethyltransferase
VNASNIRKDFQWLSSLLKGDVTLKDRSSEFGLLAIQGPRAEEVMSRLTDYDLANMEYYTSASAMVGGVELLFSRTGYTGEDGFELYVAPSDADALWEKVTEAGKLSEMQFIGLGARDSLRLEMKMALYGNDMDENTTPIEAGLGWVVNLDKDFIGKDVIARQKAEKPAHRLVCLELEGRAFPRQGYEVFDGDKVVGKVTSGIFSPSLQKPIAIARLAIERSKVGSSVEVEIRNKRFPARVVKPPFYKKASHK